MVEFNPNFVYPVGLFLLCRENQTNVHFIAILDGLELVFIRPEASITQDIFSFQSRVLFGEVAILQIDSRQSPFRFADLSVSSDLMSTYIGWFPIPDDIDSQNIHKTYILNLSSTFILDQLLSTKPSLSDLDYFIGRGMDINRLTLHVASKFPDLLPHLLEQDADIDFAAEGAAEGGHFDLMNSLIADGADINFAARGTARGAAKSGNVEILNDLLSKDADIDYAMEGASNGIDNEVPPENLVNDLLQRGANLEYALYGAIGTEAEPKDNPSLLLYLITLGPSGTRVRITELAATIGNIEVLKRFVTDHPKILSPVIQAATQAQNIRTIRWLILNFMVIDEIISAAVANDALTALQFLDSIQPLNYPEILAEAIQRDNIDQTGPIILWAIQRDDVSDKDEDAPTSIEIMLSEASTIQSISTLNWILNQGLATVSQVFLSVIARSNLEIVQYLTERAEEEGKSFLTDQPPIINDLTEYFDGSVNPTTMVQGLFVSIQAGLDDVPRWILYEQLRPDPNWSQLYNISISIATFVGNDDFLEILLSQTDPSFEIVNQAFIRGCKSSFIPINTLTRLIDYARSHQWILDFNSALQEMVKQFYSYQGAKVITNAAWEAGQTDNLDFYSALKAVIRREVADSDSITGPSPIQKDKYKTIDDLLLKGNSHAIVNRAIELQDSEMITGIAFAYNFANIIDEFMDTQDERFFWLVPLLSGYTIDDYMNTLLDRDNIPIDWIRRMLELGANLKSAITHAAWSGNRNAVNMLLTWGIVPNANQDEYRSRLRFAMEGAIQNHDSEFINDLLARGAPLLWAIYDAGKINDFELLSAWVQRFSDDPSAVESPNDTSTDPAEREELAVGFAVWGAATRQSKALMKELIDKDHDRMDWAILGAAEIGDDDLAFKLVRNGGLVDKAVYYAGFYADDLAIIDFLLGEMNGRLEKAIYGAAQAGRLDLLEPLLARSSWHDHYVRIAALGAVERGKLQVIRVISHSLPSERRTSLIEYAIWTAVEKHRSEMLSNLLTEFPVRQRLLDLLLVMSIEKKDAPSYQVLMKFHANPRNAMQIAVLNSNLETIDNILNIDPTQRQSFLNMGVYQVAKTGGQMKQERVFELLDRGANINLAVQGAAEAGNRELVQFLLKSGASIDYARRGATIGDHPEVLQ